ncbi:sigma-54-dependent transcriptional regulator [Desulfocurvus sp. DL9XJH121]
MSGPDTILVVDDQYDFAQGIRRLLAGRFPAVDVLAAGSGAEALDILSERRVLLMLTDLRMPAMNGLSLLSQALETMPALSAVMLTAHGSIETAVEALKAGAYDFLTKPVDTETLFRVAEKGLERSRLLDENRQLRGLLERRGETLIGDGQRMRQVRETIAAVARTDYTVLITGESGTGKELVARMLHDLSARAKKPYVAVNCPAIPENLLESELFGHVRGAFTGANKDREGLFAEADGGTIHLDEIGDIPPGTQTKLLRVLQEGEIRPVGSDRTRKVDVRVVASTNRDLPALIADNRFREDLYYRLNVLMVSMPPLRERIEDIPALARFFLLKAWHELGLKDKGVDTALLSALAGRDWPGNVRELQNYMRKLAVFGTGDTVTMAAMRMVDNGEGTACPGLGGGQELPLYKEAKNRVLDSFTRDYVGEILAQAKGNVTKAAKLAGLSRVALQKILARFDLDASSYR